MSVYEIINSERSVFRNRMVPGNSEGRFSKEK
jgi:hypothetical protein